MLFCYMVVLLFLALHQNWRARASSNLIYNLFQHLLIIGLGGVLWSQDCHTPYGQVLNTERGILLTYPLRSSAPRPPILEGQLANAVFGLGV